MRPLHHTPDNWDCIDCGRDTLPGSNYRLFKMLGLPVSLRGSVKAGTKKRPSTIEISLQPPTHNAEMFALHSRIWRAAGAPDGCLCVGCVERRIGRKLTSRDFLKRHPLNKPASYVSRRLRDRRGDKPSPRPRSASS